jgi:hypothetical protein
LEIEEDPLRKLGEEEDDDVCHSVCPFVISRSSAADICVTWYLVLFCPRAFAEWPQREQSTRDAVTRYLAERRRRGAIATDKHCSRQIEVSTSLKALHSAVLSEFGS